MTTTLDLTRSATALAIELRIATDKVNTTPMTVWFRYGDEPLTPVRGLENFTGYPGAFVVLDYEVPYRTTLYYEIRVGGDYDSATIESHDVGQAWLRDVLYPDDSVPLIITSNPIAKTVSRSALLAPVGRSNIVAVTDVRSGRTGSAVLTTMTAEEANDMRRLFSTGHVLLLSGPAEWRIGPVYWVAQGVEERRVGLASSPILQWSVEWVEVDPPETLLLRTPRTYDEANDVYTTYLSQRSVDYAEMLYPSGATRTAPGPRRWRA